MQDVLTHKNREATRESILTLPTS